MFNNPYDKLRHLGSNKIVLVVIAVIVVYVLYLIFSSFSYNYEIPVIPGKLNGKHGTIVEQDPNKRNAKPIYRSVNAATGLEFTWSVWVNINDIHYVSNSTNKLVFRKGSTNSNCPGLYIDKSTNNLIVNVDTIDGGMETITIKDISLHKWINVIIRCKNLYLDVYVNGTIVKRHVCSSIPKQNYGNVYVATNYNNVGGFDGYLSDLYYWNYALGTSKIDSLVESGPSMSDYDPISIFSKGASWMDWLRNLFASKHSKKSSDSNTNGVPYYYSLRWFLGNDSASSTELDYGGL